MTIKRDEVNQGMIDAAKVMPGTADPPMPSDPDDTQAVKDAEAPGPSAPTTRKR